VLEVVGNKDAKTCGGHVEPVTVHLAEQGDRALVGRMAGVVEGRGMGMALETAEALAVAPRQVGLEAILKSQVKKDKTGLMV
jgi:hypothetical protein